MAVRCYQIIRKKFTITAIQKEQRERKEKTNVISDRRDGKRKEQGGRNRDRI